MKKNHIDDINSLVEVYLTYFTDRMYEIDKIGYLSEESGFGIYFIWSKRTNNFCVLSTDYSRFSDKRIKKNITRYKNSTFFFYPMCEYEKKFTEDSFDDTLRFFKLKQGRANIAFDYTCDFNFILNHLKKY